MRPNCVFALVAIAAVAEVVDVDAATSARCDASLTKSTLRTDCRAACGYDGLCAYYPPDRADACRGLFGAQCVRADGGCVFECFPGGATTVVDPDMGTSPPGIMAYLYRTWDDVAAWAGLATRFDDPLTWRAMVNDSEVRRLQSDGSNRIQQLGVRKRPPRQEIDDYDIRRGELGVVGRAAFEIDAALFNDSNLLYSVFLNGVTCPTSKSPYTSKPDLTSLYIENCGLSALPWASDQLPKLIQLGISDNNISDADLPPTVETMYWTNNGLKRVPKGLSALKSLRRVYLDDNPIGKVARGTARFGDLRVLSFRNCSLNEVPEDLRAYESLSQLDLSLNPLKSTLNTSRFCDVVTLRIEYANLTWLPDELTNTSMLSRLYISGNTLTEAAFSNITTDLESLTAQNLGLKRIPPVLRDFSRLSSIDLRENPIAQFTEDDFPVNSNMEILFSHAKFSAAPSMRDWNPTVLNISNSALQLVPDGCLDSDNLVDLFLAFNNISSLSNGTTPVQLRARHVYLHGNRVTSASLRVNGTTYLDLSDNPLTNLTLTQSADAATPLLYLGLRNTNLTTVPDFLTRLRQLRFVDLRGNPIRDFAPSVDQWTALSNISIILFDREQLAQPLSCTTTVSFMGHDICDPRGSSNSTTHDETPTPPASDSKSNVGVIVGTTCAVVVALVIIGVWFFRRRRVSGKGVSDTNSDVASSLTTQLTDGGLWEDEELVQHRLDEQSVKIQRRLASGAFGEVFLASYLDQRVVVKRLKAEHSVDRAQFLAFVREIKLLAAFRFPNIVPFVGVVWTKEADLGVVTAFMPNGDLRAHLDATQRRSRRSSNARTSTDPTAWTLRKLRMALDVAEALVYLHSLDPPLVHRDLKSRNVLLDGEWRACLSDFGTSRAVPSELVTMTGGVGTALWMAPEVLRGERYDTACDVFSLGVILSEMDTHLMPYARVGTPSSEEAAAASRGSLASASANRSSSLMSSLRLSRSGREEASNKDVDTGATTSSVLMEVLNGTAVLQFLPTCPAPIRQLAERCASHDASERPNALVVAYELRQMLRFETEQSGRRA